MRFGAVFPAYGSYCDREFAEKIAVEAERRGIDAVLVWDHYMLPYGNRTFDAYILLSYLAARTSRVRLGTCVTPLPFRNPAMLAKMAATLDVLSGGRLIIGVGAGWHEPEFRAYSEWGDPSTRVGKTEEALELMIQLWTKNEVSFSGRFYSAEGAVLEPKPVQRPHPPLWFGTFGRRMLRLAARYGSGWIPVDISLGEYKIYAKFLRRAVGGRKDFVFAVVDWPAFGSELVERVRGYAGVGCDYYCAVLHEDEKKALEQLGQLEELGSEL